MDLYPYDPANGPAVPDLPPINIGALTVGLSDLFGRASGLVLPRSVLINETAQAYLLTFAPDPDSIRVITSWAIRFGGVVESHTCSPDGTQRQHIILTFEYFGVQVDAFTFLPVT